MPVMRGRFAGTCAVRPTVSDASTAVVTVTARRERAPIGRVYPAVAARRGSGALAQDTRRSNGRTVAELAAALADAAAAALSGASAGRSGAARRAAESLPAATPGRPFSGGPAKSGAACRPSTAAPPPARRAPRYPPRRVL